MWPKQGLFKDSQGIHSRGTLAGSYLKESAAVAPAPPATVAWRDQIEGASAPVVFSFSHRSEKPDPT